MVALYLASSSHGSGATTLAAGIGKQLMARNRKVTFFKPILPGSQGTEDAGLMRSVLGIAEPAEVLSPTFPNEAALTNSAKAVLARLSEGKEVVIVEGLLGNLGLTNELAAVLGARVVAIGTFPQDAGELANSFRGAGRGLLGVALNKVPLSRMAQARTELSGLTNRGIRGLGAIPEDRLLLSLTVSELADGIKGNVLVGKANTAVAVENIMLGAMTPDHGPEYYGHKANKAVIIRSGRPDMQLAALDTSTRCVVLAGPEPPIQMVLRRAEEKNVPLISTKADVSSVVADLERATRLARFSREKAARATEIVGENLDLAYLFAELGV